jgi:hydroxymethylpyrimidine/phosphomethylpyrimidine kinase
LTIAGSDCGGGAGIQADLKTFAAYGVHGLSATTALTAQDTRKVHSIHAVPVKHLARELETLAADFCIRAIKIGMLGSAAAIRAVARFLRQLPAPVVLDPVLISSSGTNLLPRGARRVLRDELIPLASLLTPNLPEAALLLGLKHPGDAASDARALLALGAKAVLLKGGHGNGQTIVDTLVQKTATHRFRHRRLPIIAHGTGCVLSAAIAAGLAAGLELLPAVRAAQRHLQRALRGAYRAGHGTALIVPAPQRYS